MALDAFIHTGTLAPSRALASLKWLSKSGRLAWDLQGLPPKKQSVRRQKRGQSLVVEPPMLQFLEDQIQEQAEHRVPKWTDWIVAVGVVGHRRIGPSYPVRLSRSTLHCCCLKEAGRDSRRPPLDCSINLQQRVALGREGLGAQGGVAIGDQAQRRPLLSTEQIACAEDLSTYWRRAMPTLGHLACFEGRQLLALGDWTNRTHAPEERMRLHYGPPWRCE